jgi:hypothetical protein
MPYSIRVLGIVHWPRGFIYGIVDCGAIEEINHCNVLCQGHEILYVLYPGGGSFRFPVQSAVERERIIIDMQ